MEERSLTRRICESLPCSKGSMSNAGLKSTMRERPDRVLVERSPVVQIQREPQSVIRRTSISGLLQVQIHQTIPIILLPSKGGPDAVHTSSSGYHKQSHHTIGKCFFTTTTTTTTTQTHYNANPTRLCCTATE